MKMFAARYELDHRDNIVVLYTSKRMVSDEPQDWSFSFTRSEWRKMKCRVPQKGEIVVVDLLAVEVMP